MDLNLNKIVNLWKMFSRETEPRPQAKFLWGAGSRAQGPTLPLADQNGPGRRRTAAPRKCRARSHCRLRNRGTESVRDTWHEADGWSNAAMQLGPRRTCGSSPPPMSSTRSSPSTSSCAGCRAGAAVPPVRNVRVRAKSSRLLRVSHLSASLATAPSVRPRVLSLPAAFDGVSECRRSRRRHRRACLCLGPRHGDLGPPAQLSARQPASWSTARRCVVIPRVVITKEPLAAKLFRRARASPPRRHPLKRPSAR